MDRLFPRDIGSLDDLFAFIRDFLSAENLDPARAFDVDLVAEELFTNMVKYNGPGRHDIAVTLDRAGSDIVLTLKDRDVDPFDPTAAPEVDVTRPVSERKAGGLGIHFVRQIAREVRYDYTDGVSTVTVTLEA